jgi:hypothetical protein
MIRRPEDGEYIVPRSKFRMLGNHWRNIASLDYESRSHSQQLGLWLAFQLIL